VKNSGFRLLENKVSSGTGLANTMQRLDLLYGSEHKFSIQSDSSGSTVVGFFFSGVPVG
jgi:sensor histidine kinase YesM